MKSNSLLKYLLLFGGLILIFGFINSNNEYDQIKSSTKQKNNNITAFKNIRVFDGEKTIDSCTVIIEGSKIKAVGKNIPIPKNAEIITGEDLTLLPGLIDAHVHMFSIRDLKQEAVFGVTTVLDMMSSIEFMQQTRLMTRSQDNADMADLFSAGQPATYPDGHGTEWGTEIPTMIKVSDVKHYIDACVAAGVDYIKIISGTGDKVISKEVIAELVKESKKRNLLTVVHIQTKGKAFDAIHVGVNGLAHCFADSVADADFIKEMKEKKAFVIPTLSVMNTLPDAKRIAITKDERFTNCLTPEIISALEAVKPLQFLKWLKYANAEQNVRLFHEAGIPILAGSDSYNAGTTHGASLHGELELLTYAGLSPTEALTAATSLNAKTFHLSDRGMIAPGKRADLLLVKGDPTADIKNTRNIVDVWLNGHKLNRTNWITEIKKQQEDWKKTGEIPAPTNSESGKICSFDSNDFSPEFGFYFFAISDKFFGGTSKCTIKLANDGANQTKESLLVSGNIEKSQQMPWAGAAFFPSAMESSTANLSKWDAVSFSVKGNTDSCMIMFMLTDQQMPVNKIVAIGNDWRKITIPFNELGSKDGKNIMGIIFGMGNKSGSFSIQFDEIKLIKKE